jgi:hypothetical protein
MARRHQPAIAFESGTVEKHVGSSLGTCMLYLHGRSGMTYVYIHLNNDLTMRNDNRGGCINGVAYAPGLHTGDFVRRGELVGYVGDSGDADGGATHLHFEVRTPGGRAIDPYPYLNRATRVLYPRPAGPAAIALGFKNATVLAVGAGTLTIRTAPIKVIPKDWAYRYERKVVLAVPAEAVVQRKTTDGLTASSLTSAVVGQRIHVFTTYFTPSWTTQVAPAQALLAGRIVIG